MDGAEKRTTALLDFVWQGCGVSGTRFIRRNRQDVALQCYFQAGVSLYYSNNDGVSDGEYSMGAGVDFIRKLGTEN